MATPLYTTVLGQINTYIVANGNNEITANVLNPILKIILDFASNNIGDLSTLTTDEKNSIVESINSLKQNFDNLVNKGVQLHTGYDDPNTTPPPTYNYADFYMQLDSGDDSPIYLWQWNGIEWATGMIVPVELPKIQFTADGVQDTFSMGVITATIKAVFWNGALLNDLDWSQTGTTFTLTFIPTAGDLIKPI